MNKRDLMEGGPPPDRRPYLESASQSSDGEPPAPDLRNDGERGRFGDALYRVCCRMTAAVAAEVRREERARVAALVAAARCLDETATPTYDSPFDWTVPRRAMEDLGAALAALEE